MVRGSKKFPKFPSWEEEERFWETHSTADYPFEEIPKEEQIRLPPQRKTRRRLREVHLKNPFAA